MSSPLPGLQVLVAFNNGPKDDPALITTVATPAGTLGAANVWTDITPWVSGINPARGRQHEFNRFEAGTCQLDLNNVDARFNPWNTSSPYTGLLLPKKQIQVRSTWSATTYKLFTGHVNAWPILWGDAVSAFAQLQATDAFRLFQAADITSAGYYSQVVADGPSGYWRLGDLPGSNVILDSSGHGFTGAIIPGSSITFGGQGALPADPETGAQFATSSGVQGFQYPPASSNAAGVNGTLSIECWFKSTALTGDSSSIQFGWSENFLGITAGASIEMFAGTGTGSYVVLMNSQPNASGQSIQSTPGAPNVYDGNWHHIVGTCQTLTATGGGSIGPLALYIDGVLQASVMPTSSGACLSNNLVVNPGSQSTYFQEVAVYPYILSAAQVANHYALAAFPQQRTDQRIAAVLNMIGWSATARNLDTGASQVQLETSPLTQTTSLAHMQDCETTEAGALYMTVDGKVRFASRNTLWTSTLTQTSQATFGDNPAGGEIPFQPSPNVGIDDIDIYNEADGQRSGGIRQIVSNLVSINEYGRVTWQPNGSLLTTTDAEVLHYLEYIIWKYAQPITRISSIDIDMIDLIASNQIGTVLALDLLDRVTINRHGVPGGGTAFQQVGLVERIEHKITPNSWVVTLAIDPADAQQLWIWDTSKWDQTTVWGF